MSVKHFWNSVKKIHLKSAFLRDEWDKAVYKSSLEDFENCWDYEIFENLGIWAF